MEISPELILGASATAGAWATKAAFSFILKWRKQESQSYKPDAQWKEYCMEKFETISDSLSEIKIDVAVLKTDVHNLRARRKNN